VDYPERSNYYGRKYLNIGAKSDFIPITNRNTTEIRERVLAEFGDK
jgi:hypothetical protein